MKSDTIAAIATPLSESGIGIIRVSGRDAIENMHNIFVSAKGKKILSFVNSHTINYGYIIDNSQENGDWKTNIVDEVMVSVMKSPNSYTRENTVEINCHGGVFMMQRILSIVIQNGIRLAEPGEFTKRAFLNGRIDLSKAEAVMDIIHSKNEMALQNSINQLKGNLSDMVRNIRGEILFDIAFIESALDDPEHISLDGYRDKLNEKCNRWKEEICKLLHTASDGRLIREGINTVIIGKPNAGKSSFLNLLSGTDRAIVTDIAGTTRDVLEESITIKGIGLNIIDTAGIRNTEDVVEKIGVERAKKYAERADLILYVADSSVSLDNNDKSILEMIGNKKCIVLLNKTDLDEVTTEEMMKEWMNSYGIEPYIIKTSVTEGRGLNSLKEAIIHLFFRGEIKYNQEICITNIRHKEALQDAYESIEMVRKSVLEYMPEDFYTIDLMSAYASLGRIIGEEVDDDLVNEIFSKFCMGK